MTCMVGLVKRRCNTCGVDHAGTVRNSDESVRERLLPKQVQLRMNSVRDRTLEPDSFLIGRETHFIREW